jgi:Ca2+-binding RTX toxin-like protein
MPTETQTIWTRADYTVGAAEHLLFTNQVAFQVSQQSYPMASPPHLRISGQVDVVMTSVAAVGADGVTGIVLTNTFNGAPRITVDAGGALKVSAAEGSATAYFGNDMAPPTFDNAGQVIVSAAGAARGLVNWANQGVLGNEGEVIVTSRGADAIGLQTRGYQSKVYNNGLVEVTGHGRVVGVDMGFSGTGQFFFNSGRIVAHAVNSTRPSVGVYWANGYQPGQTGGFINSGTIEADRALETDLTYGTAEQNLVVNNGRLIGEVWLGGGGAQTLVNTGLIDGVVRLIGAGSVYDGRGGFAIGPIIGGNNGGATFLGGAGGETMTGGLSNDTISGGGGDDVIDGGDGSNRLDGGEGADTLTFASVTSGVRIDVAAGTASWGRGADTFTGFSRVEGGQVNDTILGGGGEDYLRGAGGDDYIVGGAAFDDLHGNMGNDTVAGGLGDDWVVGGKDQDVLFGDEGRDIVLGNIGDDTLDGGSDFDIVRGGLGEDVLRGGDGRDYLSGDRGDDTVEGGAGADFFHGSQDAGIDRVIDFNILEGDRVMLDPGTTFTVSQQGADVVIHMGVGHRMVLVGVDLGALPPGAIFESWVVPW